MSLFSFHSLAQYIESPDVEKEVKRLLSTDAEAVSVRILLGGKKLKLGTGHLCVTWGSWKRETSSALCGCERWEISTQEVMKLWSFIFAFFKAHCFFMVTFLADCIVVLSRSLSKSREAIKKGGWGGLWISFAARPDLLE